MVMKSMMKGTAALLLVMLLTLVLPAAEGSASAAGGSSQQLRTDASLSVVNQFGEDPRTEWNFAWVTGKTINTGQVEYAPKAGFKSFDSKSITVSEAVSRSTETDAGVRMVHKVSLSGLQPGTQYVYRVKNDNGTVSLKGTFRTAESTPGAFTFLQITDTQGANADDYKLWSKTLKSALASFPDARFLIHTGDMVDSGQKNGQWEMFTSAAIPELISFPIEPTVGNHEAVNSNGTNPSDKYFTDRFNLPVETDAGAPPGTVYSFDYGYAHIAVLNTECSEEILKKEAAWLLSDMADTDRTWKIVALHRGIYGATYDSATIRKLWAPAFDRAGIDLVLQGHDHNYVRSYPLDGGKKVLPGKGTVYITANTGGVKMYPKKQRTWQEVDLQPYTQMFVAVTVEQKKLTIQAFDINKKLIDSLAIAN
jgi:hypothetical protein